MSHMWLEMNHGPHQVNLMSSYILGVIAESQGFNDPLT